MARLTYTAIASLDGYVTDETGNFDWAEPDEEVHAFINELERPIGTYLYGRRIYEVMAFWEGIDPSAEERPVMRDFARLWQAGEKVVFSRTLAEPATARTRVERTFDPEAVRELKAQADRDLSVGGPTLAAEALRAGLVDEWRLFLTPVVVGGGTSVFPGRLRARLELLEERRFAGGVVYLRYRVGS